MNPDGQVTMSWTLPGDGLGAIVNESDLASAISTSLRSIGAMKLIHTARLVVGVELRDLSMAAEGAITGVPRTSASFGHSMRNRNLRVEPDESVSDAALDIGANEVAVITARSLITVFREDR
jgi:hypothetical protein